MSTFAAHRLPSDELADDPHWWLEVGLFASLEAAMSACDGDAAQRGDGCAYNWRPYRRGVHRSRPHKGWLYQITRR